MRKVRVLAVASSGGHWLQLLRLRPAWRGCEVAYLTTEATYAVSLASDNDQAVRFYTACSANRWQKLRLLVQMLKVAWVVIKEKPTVICTTGASPGYFAIRFGKMLGAKTVWIDSVANAEEMSLAGQKAAAFSDVWLTQWNNVARSPNRFGRTPEFWGSVL